jgi:hypothetical protein
MSCNTGKSGFEVKGLLSYVLCPILAASPSYSKALWPYATYAAKIWHYGNDTSQWAERLVVAAQRNYCRVDYCSVVVSTPGLTIAAPLQFSTSTKTQYKPEQTRDQGHYG